LTLITYVEADGAEHVVDVLDGWSVMEGAVKNGVPGIVADCGGTCACGTCRVYLDAEWMARLGAPTDIEEATIDAFDDPMPGKRLACQITVGDALNGLIVRMPESQF
jgi:2Fe-2S ferredoxin